MALCQLGEEEMLMRKQCNDNTFVARRLDLGPSENIDNLEDFISLWEETTQNTFRDNWMHSLMKRR